MQCNIADKICDMQGEESLDVTHPNTDWCNIIGKAHDMREEVKMKKDEKATLADIRYVKLVPMGSVNPNNLLSDQAREEQAALLNKCLSDYPKGIIIGKDITIGRYLIGEHELTMERVTYHVGFPRKPSWE